MAYVSSHQICWRCCYSRWHGSPILRQSHALARWLIRRISLQGHANPTSHSEGQVSSSTRAFIDVAYELSCNHQPERTSCSDIGQASDRRDGADSVTGSGPFHCPHCIPWFRRLGTYFVGTLFCRKGS